jgi:hypothetical protein
MTYEINRLIEEYVNFNMDGMSPKLKEELLFDYMVDEYKNMGMPEEMLVAQIRENYGDEWFVERNLK